MSPDPKPRMPSEAEREWDFTGGGRFAKARWMKKTANVFAKIEMPQSGRRKQSSSLRKGESVGFARRQPSAPLTSATVERRTCV